MAALLYLAHIGQCLIMKTAVPPEHWEFHAANIFRESGTRFSTVPVIPGRSEPCWRPTPNPVLFDTEPKHHFMSRGAWKSKRSVMMYINPMSARRRCSNYVLDLTPGFNGLGKGGKTRRETFKFLDLVPLIYLYFGLYTLLHGFFTGNHTIALVPVKCPRRVWEHLPLSNEYKT